MTAMKNGDTLNASVEKAIRNYVFEKDAASIYSGSSF